MEREANLFAMELLMPEAWLRKDVTAPLSLMHMDRVETLAERYDVAPALMAIRLRDLGLL